MSRRTQQMLDRWASVLLVTLLAVALPARGAQVEVEITPRTTSVGMPVSVVITIDGVESHQPPALPEIDGATIGDPSRAESASFEYSGGRTRRSVSVTYTFMITPLRAGTITIPAFTVQADGKTYESQPRDIVVSPLSASTDVLHLEVTSSKERAFVGEPVELRLDIHIRRFHDDGHNYTADAQSTWGFIDLRRSRWGPFRDTLRDKLEQSRYPRGTMVMREDGDGVERAYYRYRIATRVWPERAGPLALDTVQVVVGFPTELERNRWPFRDLRVARSRQVVAAVDDTPVDVVTPPAAGRPEVYRGAVGRFEIEATAKPTDVAVGDPITVSLRVLDRGDSQLERLAAPPLDQIDALTESFRVPADPLAGIVEGHEKVFTQTLRARHAGVEAIPPIPFAYFDPKTETYQVAHTEPIPLDVRPARMVTAADVVSSGATGTNGDAASTTELTEVSGGILANATDPAALLASSTVALGPLHAILLAFPPLAYVGLLISRRATTRRDASERRRKRALRQAIATIRAAGDGGGAPQAEAIASAVRDYVADRCDLPSGALTGNEVARRLRDAAIDADLAAQTEALLAECEQVCYGGMPNGDSSALAERAAGLVTALERERLG